MDITKFDVENAYRKLKSYYYHDNTSLFLVENFENQLSIFIAVQIKIQEKFKNNCGFIGLADFC